MVLGDVRKTRKKAEEVATRFRKDFKKRGITSRKITVKPVGQTILKRLLTKKAFKENRGKKRFGVFFTKK